VASVVVGSPYRGTDTTDSTTRELVLARGLGSSSLTVALSDTVKREVHFRVIR
jgi:hypothetical protein